MTSYTTIQKDQLSKIGTHLKESREQQEKSIEDISLQTYIRPQLIKAIEGCIPGDLPQPIFVQGFIRRYAEALGLDGINIAKQFPVHSIPDTPRPTPQPASKPSMFSSQAMANPVIVSSPSPSSPKRVISTTTSRPAVMPSEPPVASPEPVQADSASTTAIPTESVASLESATTTPTPAESVASTPPNSVAVQPVPVAQSAIVPPVSSAQGMGSTMGSTNVPPNRMPYIFAGALAAVVLVAIAVASSLGGGQQNEAAQEPEAPETPAVVEAPAPPPEPEPEPEVISEAPVYLQVEVTDAGPSWMQITVDGSVAFVGMVQPGEQKLWEGQNRIAVNVGNAGAAMLSVNGADPQPAGPPGAASQKTFTPDSQ